MAWRREHRPEAIERVEVEPQLAVQVVNVRAYIEMLMMAMMITIGVGWTRSVSVVGGGCRASS